jgi:hypothetical protein
MIEVHSRRPSEWRRLFAIAADLIDQLREKAGGYEFEWSFCGGTAMMIQINIAKATTEISSSTILSYSASLTHPRAN